MPATINGIGTGYWGKDNLVTRNDTCDFCGKFVELRSYDTRLYFVVLFLPLIPLGRKRIFDDCPSCRRHRAAKLGEWERMRTESVLGATEAWQRERQDAKKATEALGSTIAFQDLESFQQLAPAVAAAFPRDAEVQIFLGDAHDHFGDASSAENAYRTALAARSDEASREALAKFYLRQGRPADADPLLTHVLADRQREKAPLLLAAAQAHQAAGDNDTAARIVDDVGTTFPELLSDPEYDRVRRSTSKYRGTNKKIKSPGFGRRSDGPRRTSWLSRHAGAFAIGCILLVAAVWYVGLAASLGTHRVAVVNGSPVAYEVDLNGRRQRLAAMSHAMVELKEGAISVSVPDRPEIEPATVQMRTSFWTRPTDRRQFVINPDRLAVVLWEQTEYSADDSFSDQELPHALHVNEVLYNLPKVDYPFEPFPRQISMKKNAKRQIKSRADFLRTLTPTTLADVLNEEADAEAAKQWARRYALISDDSRTAVRVLSSQLEPAELLAFLRPHLSDRPLRTDWHRLYQQTVQSVEPERDVVAEYRQRLNEEPNNADLRYLLARVLDDQDEAVELFKQAASGTPPSAYAHYALSFDAMSQGEFDSALSSAQQARQLEPNNLTFRLAEVGALQALGQVEPALEILRGCERQTGQDVLYYAYEVRLLAGGRNNLAAAQERIEQCCNEYRAQGSSDEAIESVRNWLEGAMHYASGDVPAYRKSIAATNGATAAFEAALTDGQYADAQQALEQLAGQGLTEQLALYVAARSANDAIADDAWSSVIESLRTGDRAERALAAALGTAAPPPDKALRNWTAGPTERALMLTALGLRHPERRAAYFAAARRLNFGRQFPSHLIDQVTSSASAMNR